MAVGDSRHYKVRKITKRHFNQTAKACRINIDQINSIIDETLSEVPGVIARATKKLYKNFPQDVADSIFNGLKERANFLKSSL